MSTTAIAYHARACALLGLRGPREAHRVATLLRWARTHHLTLPDALLEWVEVGGAEAMPIGEHARFAFFDKRVAQVGPSPALVVQTGLWQDFVHVVPLNGSDDPQVVYLSEVGGKTRAPIEIAPSFSAFIVAQAFDRRAAGEAFSKLLVSGSHHCDDLKALFTEYPSTRSLERGDERKLSRFMRSPNERMTVSVSEDVVTIDVVGEPEHVRSLDAELRARFGHDVIEVDLHSCLATVGYPEAWLETEWLSRAELVHQAEVRRAECSTRGWHTKDPLAGTEHYRTGAFGRALEDARVWSGEKLDDLLKLIALDPDPGMAGSIAFGLVADGSPLSDEAALRAARHPVVALTDGTFWAAIGRLRGAGVARSETLSHAVSLLERMSEWHQLRVMQHGVDDDITAWLATHGRNQRVRKFARHGLHQRQRPSVRFRRELRRYVTLARQLVAELEEVHGQPASVVLERWISREESPPPLRSGWRYNFHGLECHFTHPDGTVVDVALTTLRSGELVVVDFAAAVPIDAGFLAEFCRTRPGSELPDLDFATASQQLGALGAQGELALHDGYFSCA